MENELLKLRIFDAAIDEFNAKGIKFTMDSIAKKLSISKKTIYSVFKDKNTLLIEAVDHGFSLIKKSEGLLIEDDSLCTLEKLKRVLIVLPDKFKNVDWRQIYTLRDSYPEIFDKIVARVNSGWEPTFDLINMGIEEGVIRKIDIRIFKMMMEASIRDFLGDRSLIDEGITYEEALKSMIDIMIDGIIVKED